MILLNSFIIVVMRVIIVVLKVVLGFSTLIIRQIIKMTMLTHFCSLKLGFIHFFLLHWHSAGPMLVRTFWPQLKRDFVSGLYAPAAIIFFCKQNSVCIFGRAGLLCVNSEMDPSIHPFIVSSIHPSIHLFVVQKIFLLGNHYEAYKIWLKLFIFDSSILLVIELIFWAL